MVAERVGSAELASVLARFGYGTPTGVGFPGEAGGVVPELLNWTDITRATVSYGQGISMTPLQMAAVYATVANGGMWVQPRLVRGTSGPDGRLEEAPRAPSRRVLSEDTATMLTRMLASVCRDGHRRCGPDPRLPGRGEDRHRTQARGRPLRPAVHGLVRRLPAGVGPPCRDRGVDRRTADRLRRRRGRAGLLRDRPPRDPAPRRSRPRRPCVCRPFASGLLSLRGRSSGRRYAGRR